MLELILKLHRLLIKILEIFVMLVMGFLVLDVLWGVFSRKVLQHQSSWTEELARMLLVWVSLLGASIGFIRGSHLGVDYFVGKFSVKIQTIFQIVVYLFVAIFALVVMIYGGIRLVVSTFQADQIAQALGIKVGYVYLVVPISGFFIFVFSIETIINKFSLLYNKT